MNDILPPNRRPIQPRDRTRSVDRQVVHKRRITPPPRMVNQAPIVQLPKQTVPPAPVAAPVAVKQTFVQDVMIKQAPPRAKVLLDVPVTTAEPLIPQATVPRKVITPQPQDRPELTDEQLKSISVTEPIKVVEEVPSAVKKRRTPLKKRLRPSFKWKRSWWLFVLAGIIIIITGYVAIDTWLTNRNVSSQVGKASVKGASTKEENHQAAEGKDERQFGQETLDKYKVAADVPRTLSIDKLKVKSRVLPMATNPDGSIQTPKNIFDLGWYTSSTKPGEIGATFIDGHASGPTREGIFAYLDTLKIGDKMTLEKGDGSTITYQVVHTEVVPLNEVNMKKVLLPQGNVLKGLNLMTCTGTWVKDKATYDKRVIIYTEQVE